MTSIRTTSSDMGVVMQLNRLSCPFPWHDDAFSDPIYIDVRIYDFHATFDRAESATFWLATMDVIEWQLLCTQTKMLEGRTKLSECVSPGKHFSTTRIPNTVLTPLKSASPGNAFLKVCSAFQHLRLGGVILWGRHAHHHAIIIVWVRQTVEDT